MFSLCLEWSLSQEKQRKSKLILQPLQVPNSVGCGYCFSQHAGRKCLTENDDPFKAEIDYSHKYHDVFAAIMHMFGIKFGFSFLLSRPKVKISISAVERAT